VYLERLLQINIATMAALGTLLLGMGQRSAALPLWMLTAAIASVWLTDVTGWFRLNRTVTNFAAVGAFLLLLWHLFPLRWLEIIMAIGSFLVYLQIILLFQKKEPRTYASLALLSLVQVVVAAVFHQKVLFGLLLVVYLFVGLSALALLFLHRERTRHRRALSRSPSPVAGGRRWPLAGQEPVFTDATSGYAGQAGVGRELPARVVSMASGTLLLTLLVFFALPRWGHHPWRGAMASRRHTVGFSDTVTLGELGRILENPEEVLRIQFSDYATGERYRVVGELYLRGAILTHYRQGQWDHRGPASIGGNPLLPAVEPSAREGLVRQRITIEPLDRPELFCVWPFINTLRGQGLLVGSGRDVLLRPEHEMTKRFAYELATTAFDNGVQAPLVPGYAPAHTEALLEPPLTEGPGAVPGVVTLAERWVSESGLDADDHLGRARLLERQLRDSGRFEYSLEGQQRDPTIDPIEDFVTKNPRGHCEYFATALVLMLRSQGIPARMVVGYKTDEWNGLGHFFQVRQLHAHTWVEAYLAPEHYQPRADLAGPRPMASGAWLRLEPTPTGSVIRVNPVLDMVGKSFDWLNFLWANYVMEMDRPRQHEVVFDPLADALAEAGRRLADPNWWQTTFANIAAALGTGLRNLILGLAGAVLVLVLLFACHVFRIVLRGRFWRLAGRSDPAARGAGARVEFYRRLEAVLARFGLTRPASQTQREFAREAGMTIATSTGEHHLAALPGRVVEAFYRVRFGGTPLDSPQAEEVEQALRQLKQAAGSVP